MTTNDSQMTENIAVNTAPFSVLAEHQTKIFRYKINDWKAEIYCLKHLSKLFYSQFS